MSHDLPPIVKVAESLMTETSKAAMRFTRHHKYTYGADLCKQATQLARLAHRAFRDRAQQAHWVSQLVWAVDDFKLHLQLGMQLKAFNSFSQFEQFARQAGELGRQVGGWHKQLHLKGQNPARQGNAQPERAQILSSRAASPEAM